MILPVTAFDRIMRRLLPPNESGCREWPGAKHPFGYGIIRVWREDLNKWSSDVIARVIWQHHNGPIPTGLEVCHSCDNPPCGEITHFYLGTHSRNIQDAYDRKRGVGLSSKSLEELQRIRASHDVDVEKHREACRLAHLKMSPERRAQIALKGWETRRRSGD